MAVTNGQYSSDVDAEKIRELVKKSGMNVYEVSSTLGRSPGYLQKYLVGKQTRMGNSDIELIKLKYGIDIKKDKPIVKTKETSKEQEKTIANFTAKELYSLIQRAVYNGVKRAWEYAPTIEDEEKKSRDSANATGKHGD